MPSDRLFVFADKGLRHADVIHPGMCQSVESTGTKEMQKMLFLGYDRMQTSLIEKIEQSDWEVDHTAGPVFDFSDYDLVVSFGYRFIVKTGTLATARRPVINLHIAYLPWNRGAHPCSGQLNDGTPAGVTIHEMDPGVETGPICFKRR
jgi:folate-dependent phosphoribosylglycinamide formyltransferase PurN